MVTGKHAEVRRRGHMSSARWRRPAQALPHLPYQGAELAIRLYPLKGPKGTLAVELDDVKDAGHLDSYANIVQSLHFES